MRGSSCDKSSNWFNSAVAGGRKIPISQSDNWRGRLPLYANMNNLHRTKYQESVNGNVAEICETVAETRRLTRVSAVGLVTAAAVTTEPDHFFTCFRQVSVEGNKCFRKRNFVLTCGETLGYVPEIWIFFIFPST